MTPATATATADAATDATRGATVPTVEVVALPTPHRFTTGDDLAGALLAAATDAGVTLRGGDVVCVASKVVSLVEGALAVLPEVDDPMLARRALAREVAVRIVADAPEAVVVETHHGFVCANAGIDASNVGGDDHLALLLPTDPDASAAALRAALQERAGVDVGIVVTDTFGRPWRSGLTEVALGVAGTPALRDERGTTDLDGRPLAVTQAAVADEIAGAADLVRDKASGTPFVLVRGLPAGGEHGTGADLVRRAAHDLFRHGRPNTAEAAVTGRRTVRAFDRDRPVPDPALRAAVAAAATAPAPHHTRPWRFVRLAAGTRTKLLDAMAAAWRDDLVGDGVADEVVARRQRGSDAVLGDAPVLLAAFVALDGSHAYPDARRTRAERDLFVLSAGAALQSLQIVLAAHGLGAAWLSSTAFCADTVRAVLDLPDDWEPVGMVAVGWPDPEVPARERPPVDVDAFLLDR